LPNEEDISACVRELCEETGLTLIVNDLTMLSGRDVREQLPDCKTLHIYVYAVFVHVPYVIANLRTQIKVERCEHSQSIVQLDSFTSSRLRLRSTV
jgi:ADP-ribose pyrophosphatase YjhB (NUDIX family)